MTQNAAYPRREDAHLYKPVRLDPCSHANEHRAEPRHEFQQ